MLSANFKRTAQPGTEGKELLKQESEQAPDKKNRRTCIAYLTTRDLVFQLDGEHMLYN